MVIVWIIGNDIEVGLCLIIMIWFFGLVVYENNYNLNVLNNYFWNFFLVCYLLVLKDKILVGFENN